MNDSPGPRMLKYGVAVLILCLWAGISAWIVAGEGESYRQDLARKLASTAVTDPSPKPDPVEKPATTVALAPKPEPEPSPPPAVKPEPKPPVVVHHDPKPAPQPADASRPTIPHDKTSAKETAVDPFWEEPNQKKVWDLERLTPEDERQLGKAINQAIRRYHHPVDSGPLPKRLEDAAEPYLKAVTRKDVKYTFTVLDCPLLNVFSHPGGYIYVCKGLFDWIAEDEDYALGFILAHEIEHVDLAHSIICLRDPEVKKLNLATVPLFFFVAIPGGYLEDQDFQADRWALERMMKAGRSRYESLAFLRRLEDYAKANGFENEPPKKPNDEPRIPWLDNHIRTHPIPRNRLKALKAILDPARAPKA